VSGKFLSSSKGDLKGAASAAPPSKLQEQEQGISGCVAARARSKKWDPALKTSRRIGASRGLSVEHT